MTKHNVRQREAKGHPVRRGLRYHGVVDEAGRAGALGRAAAAVRVGAEEARTAVVSVPKDRVGFEQRARGYLAGHGRGHAALARAAFACVDRREARHGGQKRRSPLAHPVRAHHGAADVAGEPHRGAIDVLGPVLDLAVTLPPVGALGSLIRRVAAADEPLEDERKDESRQDDRQNEDEGAVQNNLGRNAADRLGIDGADLDYFLEALGVPLVVRRLEHAGHVAAADGPVDGRVGVPQLLEAIGDGHLALVEPVEVEVKHGPRVDDEVAGLVSDVVPGEVHVGGAAQVEIECVSRVERRVAAIAEVVGDRQVRLGRPVLVEGSAGEVPGQVLVLVRRHVRALG